MTRMVIAAAFAVLVAVPAAQAQFKVPAKGMQTFNVADKNGRNQAVFHSKAPLEDITGTTSALSGTVRFDPANVAKTLSADISIEVKSLKTGIEMRDEHLRGEGWMNADKYPTVNFAVKSVKNAKMKGDNTMEMVAVGDFTMHGVTSQVEFPVTLTYLPESEKTKQRAPGDLLSIRGKGTVSLTKHGVKAELIGSKVADMVQIELNAVASNKTN